MYLLGAVIYAFFVEDARPFPRIKDSDWDDQLRNFSRMFWSNWMGYSKEIIEYMTTKQGSKAY